MDISKFDGSGRPPRELQVDALKWVNHWWDKVPVLAMQGPPGVGKTAIAKAIQNSVGGHIVMVSNQLLDQTTQTYPNTPVLKGRDHYSCEEQEGLTCGDVKALGKKLCNDCPYRKARAGICQGIPTFVNPASYYYASMMPKFKEPDVLIIDEAHKLYNMALMFVDSSLGCDDYKIPPNVSTAISFTDWAPKAALAIKKEGEKWLESGAIDKASSKAKQASRLLELVQSVKEHPENYLIYRDRKPWRGRTKEYLFVRPILAPVGLLTKFTSAKKVVLMSATLFKSDIQALMPGRSFAYLDQPSPMPKERRPIYMSPVAARVNRDLDPRTVAAWIRKWRRRWPDKNTLVHVSYGWSEKLRPLFSSKEAMFNTKENKTDVIEAFKKNGGLFIAAGCAEGVDFPGDECRLNLIPILHRENLGDKAVQKRKSLPGGGRAYDLEILKTTFQQVGRGNRGPDDESTTIIGDPGFAPLIYKYLDELPRSSTEAIVWGRRP